MRPIGLLRDVRQMTRVLPLRSFKSRDTTGEALDPNIVKAILRALYLGENWRIRPEQGRLRPVLYGGKKTGYTYLQPWIKGDTQ